VGHPVEFITETGTSEPYLTPKRLRGIITLKIKIFIIFMFPSKLTKIWNL
jgi:hypothetical protein